MEIKKIKIKILQVPENHYNNNSSQQGAYNLLNLENKQRIKMKNKKDLRHISSNAAYHSISQLSKRMFKTLCSSSVSTFRNAHFFKFICSNKEESNKMLLASPGKYKEICQHFDKNKYNTCI